MVELASLFGQLIGELDGDGVVKGSGTGDEAFVSHRSSP
jgi:hypothetical protein